MNRRTVDLAVLGGGAAGLAAVREARRRGASATLINNGPLGGDCTFTGCVPSKTLIEAARAGASFDEAFARVGTVVATIASSENADALRAEGVEVIDDEGALVGPGTLRVGDTEWKAKGVVLALGSRPVLPPIPGLADADPLTSDTVWDLTTQPDRLAVIGGGAIGCELGLAMADLGVAVTLIEAAPRLLPSEEEAASGIVAHSLKSAGVDVRLGVGVVSVGAVDARAGSGAPHRIELSDGSTVDVDRILAATGRRPNSDRGSLIEAGVTVDERGYVVAGDNLATSVGKTWVAGDLSGKAQLTHAADHMGRLAAANILGPVAWGRFRAEEIPRVTYTSPEVAAIGLSEAEAAQRWGERARVAELPLHEHDRALAADATDGYLKLIAGPKRPTRNLAGGRLVGATVVADRAGEMMAELSVVLKLKPYLGRIALTVHPYPTWSYAIPKTLAQFFTTIEGRTARPARG